MNFSIIYYSRTGTTGAVARYIQNGAQEVPETDVRLFSLHEESMWDLEFLQNSPVILFGTPTYQAGACWQLEQWFELNKSISLEGKLGGAFATENYPSGGGEMAVSSLHTRMLVHGMLVYSSGITSGKPFIHIGPTIVRESLSDRAAYCGIFGRRFAEKAHNLFQHMENQISQ